MVIGRQILNLSRLRLKKFFDLRNTPGGHEARDEKLRSGSGSTGSPRTGSGQGNPPHPGPEGARGTLGTNFCQDAGRMRKRGCSWFNKPPVCKEFLLPKVNPFPNKLQGCSRLQVALQDIAPKVQKSLAALIFYMTMRWIVIIIKHPRLVRNTFCL